MKVTTRKAALGGLAMFGAAVLLAGCGSAPEDSGSTDGGEASDFLPCMVSDAGGFDDKSFNQLGFEGLTKAADELGVEPVTVQSDSETDYAPNLTNLVDQGCNLITTVGFALAAAAGESAEANPDIEYVSIDDTVDLDFDGTTDFENIKPIVFDTAQAAFLAGYAAADYSKTGVVGTFGGMNFPTVSIFMDGFKQGVDYHNTEKGTNVQVLGWDGTDGLFTGGFEANDTARNTAQGLIDQNVDVLLPVGGPIYQSAAAAIRDSGREIAMIGVDADFTADRPVGGRPHADLDPQGHRRRHVRGRPRSGQRRVRQHPVRRHARERGRRHRAVPRLRVEGSGRRCRVELDDLKAAIIAGDVEVTSYLAE